MNKQIKIDVKAIKKFFKKGKIRKIAKKSGFIQRKGKLDAFEFFLALTFGSLTSTTITLDSIAENLTKSISRAGIQDRFNKYASNFFLKFFPIFLK